MLGQRDKAGAAARLRRWCRGEDLGWAFDNERDELDMTTRLVGFDTTAILRDELVCSPTLSYLFYRTRQLIDGRPIVLAVDEFWQTDKVEAFRAENNDHLKTIRKNEGVVLLATQSAHDALNSPVAHTIKQQTPTKIFFGEETALRAFSLVGLLLAFQLVFGLLFGSAGYAWVAEIAGFVTGFALSFLLVPGGLRDVRERIRHR